MSVASDVQLTLLRIADSTVSVLYFLGRLAGSVKPV